MVRVACRIRTCLLPSLLTESRSLLAACLTVDRRASVVGKLDASFVAAMGKRLSEAQLFMN